MMSQIVHKMFVCLLISEMNILTFIQIVFNYSSFLLV